MKSDLILLSGDASFTVGFVTRSHKITLEKRKKQSFDTYVSFVACQSYLSNVVKFLHDYGLCLA
jgi:hypothetical protein